MNRRNRSTRSGGIPLLDDPVPVKKRRRRVHVGRTLRALVELARAHRRIDHVPTLMQVRALAHFDGREPCSYLLDPKVNYVPELPLAAGTRSAGTGCASPAATRTADGALSW